MNDKEFSEDAIKRIKSTLKNFDTFNSGNWYVGHSVFPAWFYKWVIGNLYENPLEGVREYLAVDILAAWDTPNYEYYLEKYESDEGSNCFEKDIYEYFVDNAPKILKWLYSDEAEDVFKPLDAYRKE